ncbi:lysozyme [Agarilytica rhodophyticola]|uniref:lysozyme n=1 Tax=Agarilytica rhodophyticola TaxID=1737490 RepID=UPI000B34499D|nr:lysozyme [Agarilytica rhodophyticola]
MRKTNQAGIDLIKKYEGFSNTVYICPANYPTIGYGHLIRDHDDFSKGVTEEEADQLLKKDLTTTERAVTRLINVPLTAGQFDALVSSTFNLGAGTLQRSTLRRKLNRSDYDSVPYELKKWVWAGRKKLKGLANRRSEEASLYWLSSIKNGRQLFHSRC